VVTEAATSTYTIYSGDCPRGLRILDVWAYAAAAGGAADTVQVFKGTSAVTNALDLNVADNTRVAATTLDDAYQDIEKGGSLSITTASGAVARVNILAVWKD
jgi:predicted ATP-dependent protease